MTTINVRTIPTFQEYGTGHAIEYLEHWFRDQGYETEIKTAPSGCRTLRVLGLNWTDYAFRGDTDPADGVLEPWDDETMIFVRLP